MTDVKKAPKGTQTWRIPKGRNTKERFVIHVKLENFDTNPLIFKQYTKLVLDGDVIEGAEVVLQGIWEDGDPIKDVIANGYSVRACIPLIGELMIVEDVIVKKN